MTQPCTHAELTHDCHGTCFGLLVLSDRSVQTFLGSFSETGALCIVMLIIIYIAAGVGQVFFQNQLR